MSTFAVSALASNYERMGKPFNPLLGETYELKRNDFRIVCEQVSITKRWTKRLVRGRGGTIPIPKNRNSGSLGYSGGIGSGIGIRGIVKGIRIPHFTNRQKEPRFMIPKFEESCHL